jgi:hypothetical protein
LTRSAKKLTISLVWSRAPNATLETSFATFLLYGHGECGSHSPPLAGFFMAKRQGDLNARYYGLVERWYWYIGPDSPDCSDKPGQNRVSHQAHENHAQLRNARDWNQVSIYQDQKRQLAIIQQSL